MRYLILPPYLLAMALGCAAAALLGLALRALDYGDDALSAAMREGW